MSELGNYDGWKAREPDYSHPDDDTRCPHGEDTPDDCPTCSPDDGPCDVCMELQRNGIDVPCSICTPEEMR
jgi:hypothetical protein